MAKRVEPPSGSWLLAEDFFDQGDPAFVDEIRRISSAEKLGSFAATWFSDTRPEARRLLLEYLNRPLNAFRHEPLVKRLFKLAENANDDQVMGSFLVAFDRATRRIRKKKERYDWATRQSWTEETIKYPRGAVLPKEEKAFRYRDPQTGERLAAPSRKLHDRMRLFELRTRRYLRRRSWRYFRNLGKTQPARYVPAAVEALCRYVDADVPDGLALIDNWSLIHLLFHHTDVLEARAAHWVLVDGRTLADLKPAPAFPQLWEADAAPLIKVLLGARCRTVRQWALQMLNVHHPQALSRLPLKDLLAMLSHEDPELAQMAADALPNSPELSTLTVDDWLRILDDVNPQSLDVVCDLMVKRLDPSTVSFERTIRLAASRPLPIARLGFTWLQAKPPSSEAETLQLLQLAEAEALALRPEMLRWLKGLLGQSPHFRNEWILELLDSRHADVRDVGWDWFLGEPRASQDVGLWQKLLESPYDNLRLNLIAMLDDRTSQRRADLAKWDRSRLDADLVRLLWATVLLNVHRGSRTKPRVVSQIVTRLQRHPNEADKLLPILSAALRSVRGPEWRSGLAALVQLSEQSPELQSKIEETFPELKLTPVV